MKYKKWYHKNDFTRAKDLKKSDFENWSDYTKAFKEAKNKERIFEQKKKRRKYDRLYYKKASKELKLKKAGEKRSETAKKKREQARVPRIVKLKEFDFLKYRFVVDYYFQNEFFSDLTKKEFDLLLFLYSEPAFNRDFFLEVTRGMSWNNTRLDEMIRKNYIYVYVSKEDSLDKRRAETYKLTVNTQKTIARYYKTILMLYELPETARIWKTRSRSYTDYQMLRHAKEFNKRREEYHMDIALKETDMDRFDINQRTFAEIYEDVLKDLDV